LDGDKIVIKYRLSGKADEEYGIKLSYATDDSNYDKVPKLISGDVNEKVKPGIERNIIWTAKEELINYTGTIRFKITTEDLLVLSKNTKIQNRDFFVEYINHEKIKGGFKITARIRAKSNIKANFNSTSYTVDNLGKIYNLTTAKIAGIDISLTKYAFVGGVSETVDLIYLNENNTEVAESLRGFQIHYGKDYINLNF